MKPVVAQDSQPSRPQRSHAKKASSRRKAAAQPPDPSWIRVLKGTAVIVFIVLIFFTALAQELAGRVFWTVAIAGLPLFIVIIGYHRWRKICPLAWIAQLPWRLGQAGQRRAGNWLQKNYYWVAFSIFLASLWLRLTVTNGDGIGLSFFLILISISALLVGLLFTGKTWCNYFCPVSFVEKIYTEPRGLRETPNSQCPKCTACKRTCPDINQENGYWKEILLDSKRYVYYGFPGLVFAFYFYYYLQAGSWDYYFGGSWTNQPGLFKQAFLPGFDEASAGLYFLPGLPRAVAAAGTLLAGALSSWALLSGIEGPLQRLLNRRKLVEDTAAMRHVMFSLAAFLAFITFYTFAGAPTLQLVTGLPHFFQLAVVITATLFLVRRIVRRQDSFAEETLARKIIARWEWTDMRPPRDLHEAFLIHSIRSQSRAETRSQVLGFYKSAVREVVESGFISRSEIQRLDSLRNKLQISGADHERVMADLDSEERALIDDPKKQVSAEKRLQLQSYSEALGAHLERAEKSTQGDDSLVRRLRVDWGVTLDEHSAVLERLLENRTGIARRILEAPRAIEGVAAATRRLEPDSNPAGGFLRDLLKRSWRREVDLLLQAVASPSDQESRNSIRAGLLSAHFEDRKSALKALGSSLGRSTLEGLLSAQKETQEADLQSPDTPALLRLHLKNRDPYLRAATLYYLDSIGSITEEDFEALAGDDYPLVRETVSELDSRKQSGNEDGVLTVARMAALRSVSMFDVLEAEDLAQLAKAAKSASFKRGETLCREGLPGKEVFVLLEGEVEVFRSDGQTDRLVGIETSGDCIGELAVMDPAPRAATVIAGSSGAQVLRLDGDAFRDTLNANPAVSFAILRTLAHRLRRALVPPTGRTP